MDSHEQQASEALTPGLYETLIDSTVASLTAEFSERVRTAKVDVGDAPIILSRYVAERLQRQLSSLPLDQQLKLTNALIASIPNSQQPDAAPPQIPATPRQLQAVRPIFGTIPERPTTPLADVALLTNSPHEPQIGKEIGKELQSADRVELICAFLKWSGISVLEKDLQFIASRGTPFRVLTTVYMGASDRKAIDALAQKYGAEIRISYETKNTRLHAKAWLFHRNSGFSTAYVGSSNLSRAAMLDGLEWNVRLSSVSTPTLIRKFEAAFESYWSSAAFEAYEPARDRVKLTEALAAAGGAQTQQPLRYSHINVRPYPYQQVMLDELHSERVEHGRTKNLMVAATGTGKTVMAALDFRRLQAVAGRELRLLFIAHRREIIEQARQTYADVLNRGDFGEVLAHGLEPRFRQHVFATVQSLSSDRLAQFTPEHFDVIVFDEFHHAEAPTYRRVLSHFQPGQLLGLTATPERADGKNVADEFFDGRIATQIRLWDALDQGLLTPFHYFGLADGVDVSSVKFSRGGYDDAELSSIYTSSVARVRKIISAVEDKITTPQTMRALGFCVSVEHADFMAKHFNAAGLPSRFLSSKSSPQDRDATIQALARGEIRAIFTVDLFNEGIDIPSVDTILMLRPTQSATLFLQQLGRGLRLHDDKPVLTVLDFIGMQHQDFRFDIKLSALTGSRGHRLVKDVQQEFPFLPSGSQIVFDNVAQDLVLNNVRRQLDMKLPALVQDVMSAAKRSGRPRQFTLNDYLAAAQLPIEEIYRRKWASANNNNVSWTTLRKEAGLIVDTAWPPTMSLHSAQLTQILHRVRVMLGVNDDHRRRAYEYLLHSDAPLLASMSTKEQRQARMLFFSFWPDGGAKDQLDVDQGLARLRQMDLLVDEIKMIMESQADLSRRRTFALEDYGFADVPLRIHGTYSREEILGALSMGEKGSRAPSSFMEGVYWSEETQTDALLVTLNKSDRDFSPNVMYEDYALTPELFHWQSQNRTAPDSRAGQRYQKHRKLGTNILLFVRSTKSQSTGARPFFCLGPVEYQEHHGSRPMNITWKLRVPMPMEVFADSSAVAPLAEQSLMSATQFA